MVKVLLRNHLKIQIVANDRQYYEDLKNFFSYYVTGYRHMPRYLNTRWDGKVSLLNYNNKTLPYGLFFDFYKFHIAKYRNLPLEVEDKVKRLFTGIKLKPKYDLKLKPHDYQIECINAVLKYKRCIIHTAQASGKSLIISYILKTLLEKFNNNQYLIIVPTINLVEQFRNDIDRKSVV